jgi:Asp/Glu/hydantoin racemase
MKRFLVINPNTTVEVTHLLKSSMLQFSSSLIEIETVTASFGANYIADEASYVIASYSVLDSWSQSLESDRIDFDHILIGCFGDPGLHALKECSRIPVTGLAHASFLKASQYGSFGVVTGGQKWGPMIERLAGALGFGNSLKVVSTLDETGLFFMENPQAGEELLIQACNKAIDEHRLECVIIGGAALTGFAQRIQSRVKAPLIDCVQAAIEVMCAPAQSMNTQDCISARLTLTNVTQSLQKLHTRSRKPIEESLN